MAIIGAAYIALDEGFSMMNLWRRALAATLIAGGAWFAPQASAQVPCIPGLTCPSPDTNPPTVSITSPASGATVSGTINVTATASDNRGVAGGQFRLDGVNSGADDGTAPYSTSWDTTTASNGSHTLTAIARRFQCDLKDLAKANGIKAPRYSIRPGQRLSLAGCTD